MGWYIMKRTKRTKKIKRTGYTLWEVLIVVIVIAILISMGVPLYNKLIVKSDVSDALNNISMFAQAQGKHLVSKGSYAYNINDLETPLKGTGDNIVTANFTYSVGDTRDNDYCIYAESRDKNLTLAKNYRRNSAILCTGADCEKIDFTAEEGVDETCHEDPEECNLVCVPPRVLEECNCVCDGSCGEGKVFDADCNCVCSGSCGAGKVFDSNCNCVCDGSCPGNKVFDSNCNCVCNLTQADCPAGKVVDTENCVCKDPETTCPSPQVVGPNDECGCMMTDPLDGIWEPTFMAVGAPCMGGWGIWTISENCECVCDPDALVRDCGGIYGGYDLEGCGCPFYHGCSGSNDTPCPEGYARLDSCGDCELLVECPPGQVQVPGNPDDYGGLPSGICACYITGNTPPYSMTYTGGNNMVGVYLPPGTRCSNTLNDPTLPGRLSEDCRCVEQ